MEIDSQRKKDIAFWILILIVIGLAIFLIRFIRTESYSCMNEPLVYGVSKVKASDGEFTCSCSTPNSGGYILVTAENTTYISFTSSSEK